MPFSRNYIGPGATVRSALSPVPVVVVTTTAVGTGLKIVGIGRHSNQAYQQFLSNEHIPLLGLDFSVPDFLGDSLLTFAGIAVVPPSALPLEQ